MRRSGKVTVQPTQRAAEEWGQRVREVAKMTMFPETDSWYVGANIPGKPREMLAYPDGVDYYRELGTINEASGYPGLSFSSAD
jgi:hypothetical protein